MTLGEKYTHIETKNVYRLVGFAKMKNTQTRQWEEAVIYMADPPEPLGNREIYVREKKDFAERFVQT